MSINPGQVAFQLAFEISPIILTGGVATAMGGALPIVALTEGANFLVALLRGGIGSALNPNNYFAHFKPIPGSTLIANEIAHYPFANQTVAANAIISQPLSVSLLMWCPATADTPTPLKLATMSALQKTLQQHSNLGGTYSVVTPAYIYTYCILKGLRDVTGDDSIQKQMAYQFDFEQPLVSIQAAQTSLNGLMQTLANGTPISGTPGGSTGLGVTNPTTLLQSSIVPQPELLGG